MATDLGKVGIVMKGDWSSSATYEVLDAVSYNGGLYIAKQDVSANTAPTNTTYWQAAVATRGTQTFLLRLDSPITLKYSISNWYYFGFIAKCALLQGVGKILYWVTIEGGTPTITNILTGATVAASNYFNVTFSDDTVTITSTSSGDSYVDIII